MSDPTKSVCPICLDTIVIANQKQLKCNHTFCANCIDSWLKHHSSCPCCRQPVNQPRQITYAGHYQYNHNSMLYIMEGMGGIQYSH